MIYTNPLRMDQRSIDLGRTGLEAASIEVVLIGGAADGRRVWVELRAMGEAPRWWNVGVARPRPYPNASNQAIHAYLRTLVRLVAEDGVECVSVFYLHNSLGAREGTGQTHEALMRRLMDGYRQEELPPCTPETP